MGRPVTLFTGQWADLPLEELAAKAASSATTASSSPAGATTSRSTRPLSDDGYCRDQRELLERHGLKCWAIGDHLVGQAVCDPIDSRHQADPARGRVGRRRPGGRPAARGREDEGHGARRRPARRPGRRPASPAPRSGTCSTRSRPTTGEDRRARLRGLRRALEPDHRRVRRGGRPLRARGASHRDRLRLPHDAEGARGDRTARGLRHQLRPLAPRAPVPRFRRVRRRASPTASTTCT